MKAAGPRFEMRTLPPLFGAQRLAFTLTFTVLLGTLIGLGWKSGMFAAQIRVIAIGLAAMLVFGLIERWPRQLPNWSARWALQVLGVAVSIPITTLIIYKLSTLPGAPPFWKDPDRLAGFGTLTVLGLFLAPWLALGALVRQKDALARHQALAFDLERSELERQALDARLHLLQAQVAPHFLFNTLANVQALVDAGSPRAAAVLRSLVAYLRAAVPRLDEAVSSLAQELDLVQAYLELMHMRIPDRLQFTLKVDPAARELHFPPMALLTLVENAVRHGIDPSEEGGRIDIVVQCMDGRCHIAVVDSGVGLAGEVRGLGTGLSALRERLRLQFGDRASLRISAREPSGVLAEIDWPIEASRA